MPLSVSPESVGTDRPRKGHASLLGGVRPRGGGGRARGNGGRARGGARRGGGGRARGGACPGPGTGLAWRGRDRGGERRVRGSSLTRVTRMRGLWWVHEMCGDYGLRSDPEEFEPLYAE
jgi:hypothetical protein